MNSELFVSVIRKVVRNSAIKGVIHKLKKPSGRNVPDSVKQRSNWFNSLSDEERNNIEKIIINSVDETLFGFLCVIDGVRTIEDNEKKGVLKLVYKNKEELLLNDPDKKFLHDLYKEDN